MNPGCSLPRDPWQPLSLWSTSALSPALQQPSAVASPGFPKSFLKLVAALFPETLEGLLQYPPPPARSQEPPQIRPVWECLRPHSQQTMASRGGPALWKFPPPNSQQGKDSSAQDLGFKAKKEETQDLRTLPLSSFLTLLQTGALNVWIHTCSEFPIKSGWMLISAPPHPYSRVAGPTHELTIPSPGTLQSQPRPGLGHDFFPSLFTP